MRIKSYLFLLLIVMLVFTKAVNGQVVSVTTAEFRIPKDSCRLYIYEMQDYLKAHGLYEGEKHQIDTVSSLKDLKKKITFDGKLLVDDYQFIIDIWGSTFTEDIFYDWGDFGIIEIGMENEEKAHKLCLKAQGFSKTHAINIPPYIPPFRAVQANKSVLLVYSIHHKYDELLKFVERWKPAL